MAAVAVVVKDLVEAVRAEDEVGLGKECVAGGVGIERRGLLGVLKRWVLVAGFLKGRDNRLLLGFLNGNESFCIPSKHFPHAPFFVLFFCEVQNRDREGGRERD
jgi:hypothetical protein